MRNIQQTIEKLYNLIQEKELEVFDIIKDSPAVISILENGFTELKDLVSNYQFSTNKDEIKFFKETKPQLFSKLIFLRKKYLLELNLPISNYSTIQSYLEKEQDQLNLFSYRNIELIKYYRSGKTVLDEYYFTRGKNDLELNRESFYFERDPNFSTHYDFKIAKILANDMLAIYLNNKLSSLKYQMENNCLIINTQSKGTWTDKKVALVELIYALHSEGSISNGKIELKTLTEIFENIFNIDLSDLYHIYLEIRTRKKDRTICLNRLIKALNKRMDEADSK